MCDTIIATPSATKNGRLLFGKNSDREPDEVQNLVYYPPREIIPEQEIKCTYISIPMNNLIQENEQLQTNGVLLSQPFWMFGGEMGINDKGVVIGNEALMTKVKPAESGLTGMDLLRLALEMSNSALEAVQVIIRLLEKFGQGGMCGYRHKLYYMNGFLIGDSQDAYVLETVGKEWAWKKIENVWSISNKISLEKDLDQRSENLIEFAIQKGWCHSESDFNFSKCYSDKIITWGAQAKGREQHTRHELFSRKGELTIQDMMSILRSHHEIQRNTSNSWRPMKGLRMTVCAHATNNLTRTSQSVNSLVVEMYHGHPLILSTGASNPCISPYFPICIGNEGLPTKYTAHTGKAEFSPENFWWRSEKIHRQVVLKYQAMHPPIATSIKEYENSMLEEIKSIFPREEPLPQEIINKHYHQVEKLLSHWEQEISKYPFDPFNHKLRLYWRRYNKLNEIP
ncbi:MAG: hypothetical protein DRO88_10665 [Promethearchaeia archaeon]|nr:MAG: hypothetical protein DRO88_10665 [Candidatus Lokiarchaeia archaeon]